MKRLFRICWLLTACLTFGYSNNCAQATEWSLKMCIDKAIENNITLKQGKQKNDLNRINLRQSKENLLPNLNYSDAHTFSFGRSVDPVSYQYTTQSISSNNMQLGSSLTLFNGLQNIYTIQQAKLNYSAGTTDIETLKNDLSINVLMGYFQLLLEKEDLKLAQSQIEVTKKQIERAQQFVDVGKATEGSVLQLKAQLANDELSRTNAEGNLQMAKVLLMQLMEIPVDTAFDIVILHDEELAPAKIALLPPDIYNTAQAFLPQIRGTQLRISAAESGLKIARGAYSPQLTFQANLKSAYSSARKQISYQTTYQTQPIGYLESNPTEQVMGAVPSTQTRSANYPFFQQLKDNFSQAVSFSLYIPIFNNLTVRNNVDKAKIAVSSAQLDAQATKNQLRKTIEQAYTDQLSAGKKFDAAQEQVNAERRAYSDLEQKFMQGLTTTTELLVEKGNHYRAQQLLVEAKYNYAAKNKVLQFYMGNPLTQ